MSKEPQTELDEAKSVVSNVSSVECSTVANDGFVLIQSHPCKIINKYTTKTSKHGKMRHPLVGVDVFTGLKYEETFLASDNVEIPVVKYDDYKVVNISTDDILSLMPESGDIREDIKIPEGDVGVEVRTKFANGEAFLCTVVCAMGREMVVATKPNTSK